MNPEDLTIVEYLDTSGDYNKKHVYLFPQRRELTIQEREKIALALLGTIPYYLGNLGKGKTMKFPVFLSHRQRSKMKRNYRRYKKWRKKH